MKNEITLDAWLNELLSQDLPDAEGYTVQELANSHHCSRDSVLKSLRTCVDAGEIGVGWAFRTRIDGRSVRVPVYRLIKKGKKRAN